MGVGVLVGGVPSVFHFMNPRSGDPYVSAWLGSVVLLWILGSHWMFGRRGAEQLVRHPGLIRPPFNSVGAIKALWIASVAGGIIAIAVIYLGDFTPRF